MQSCAGMLFLSLILCTALSETFGLVLSAKEKRGWTLNSAGYLLGPHALEKPVLAGKRDMNQDEIKTGNILRTLADDNAVRTVIEFLTYMHLKDIGALDKLPSLSSEEANQ
ncbi:galanin peptides [Protopterus annectens]|uniref:galanin peptides n=1 Tax=Protopterus annectens TaxID=7888 RepID=UPI001CFA58FE|nr:galanin peptides [Protopterus annectens]